MIGYLRGEIIEHSEGKMLVAVGSQSPSRSTVGYLVSVPQNGSYTHYFPGEETELYIHTHVREDALDLYGFCSKFEKSLFLTLLGVNGIGPKSALGILSAVEAMPLVDAIVQGDQAFLTGIPGIGKKTAERVIVELRDSLKKKLESGFFGTAAESVLMKTGSSSQMTSQDKVSPSDLMIFQDAKQALIGLGYKEQDIQQLLRRVLDQEERKPRKVEDLVRSALKQLA